MSKCKLIKEITVSIYLQFSFSHLVHPAAGLISTCSPGSQVDSVNSPGSHANNISLPSNDKLTKVQLYMSTSCQPGSRVIQAFFDVEKPFLFSDLAIKAR